MTLISARDSAHDFIVKFMCVAVVASLTREMAAQSFAYRVHGIADSDKFCCYPWFVCHDKTLNQQCITRSGSPTMINHLTTLLCLDVPTCTS